MINEYSYNQYNYWTIPLTDLPTRGLFYDPNAMIKLRGMTVMEVKFLATYQPMLATEICNEILSKCAILDNIKLEDLYLPDRMYLIFWIRNNSFTNRNGYNLHIKACEHCKQPYDTSIKLEEFNIKYLDEFESSVFLPDTNIDMPISIPKFKDSLEKPTDDTETVALYLDTQNTFEDKCKFVENLTALDYATLYNHVVKNSCGFQELFEIRCPHCGAVSHVMLKMHDDTLFNAVKLFDILETITRICKYSNLQITNDWSWVEVEIEQQVINKLIKEEEEQNRKEIAKAKASANAHTPSMPSRPHF